MQPDYPARFARDTGGTESEWLGRLPGACNGLPLTVGEGEARVAIGAGSLRLRWHALPPRRIALLAMARLQVEFAFDGLDDAARERFMRHFDLYMQRGGG